MLSQNIIKIEGGPLAKKIEKKSHNAENSIGCYAEKEEKLFWFCSLDQMSQFGTIKLCRTFKNYFGQFVWIEKIKKKKKSLS